MSIVLIVSKTQMRNSVCVGGIREDNCELIRIFDAQGYNLSPNVPYEIGDRWEMCVENVRHMRMEPHVEDKRTRAIRRIENVGVEGIARFINEHTQALGNRIVKGNLEQAFEGCLHLQGTRNFVNRDRIPSFSTQFWMADKDLIHRNQYGKHYYYYNNIRIKFVGYQSLVERIPAGTIIRLSLATWWSGDNDGKGEDRCYLQLSGWYWYVKKTKRE